MKVNTVSAFRDKRGLHRVSGAEPPVVGLTPQTTEIRKTDTMKTYILRPAKTVENFWPGTDGSLLPAALRRSAGKREENYFWTIPRALPGAIIFRPRWGWEMKAMAERMRQQPEKFKLRKTLAEHPFGTIKRWFGYTHFLLKGLTKVGTEWSLTTLAYNLKRVLNLVSFEKLMAAVG